MASLSPDLAKLLYYASLSEMQLPQQFDNCYAIVRVGQRIPAQLDNAMRYRLLEQQFDRWFQDQLRQLPKLDRHWMGIADCSDIANVQAGSSG